MDTILGSQPFKGQRLFLIDSNKLLLRSLYSEVYWLPGQVMESNCHVMVINFSKWDFESSSHSFDPNCSCGFWSCFSRRYLGKVQSGQIKSSEVISAQIEQWGRVAKHEFGYRSEYARIIPETIHVYPRQYSSNVQKKILWTIKTKYMEGK